MSYHGIPSLECYCAIYCLPEEMGGGCCIRFLGAQVPQLPGAQRKVWCWRIIGRWRASTARPPSTQPSPGLPLGQEPERRARPFQSTTLVDSGSNLGRDLVLPKRHLCPPSQTVSISSELLREGAPAVCQTCPAKQKEKPRGGGRESLRRASGVLRLDLAPGSHQFGEKGR